MKELVDYIKAARQSGENDESIILSLKSVGWDDVVIAENMKQAIPDLDQSVFLEPLPAVSLATSVTPPQNSAVSVKKPGFNFRAFWKYGKYILAIILVGILAFGGYYAYSYFTNTPEKVWVKALVNMAELESAGFNFETSYTEKIPKEKSDLGFLSNVDEVKFSASGAGKLAINSDASDADYDMNSTLGAKFGTMSFNVDFQSKKKGDYVYYKMDNNPLASLFAMGTEDTSETSDWVKLNLKESVDEDTKLLTTQKDLLMEAYKKVNIVKLIKLINTEKVNEKNTLHYQAEIDKNELKKYFESVQKILGEKDDIMNVDYASFVDKIEYKKMEVWIGKSDKRIHQVLVDTNFPSLMSYSLEMAQDKSRDARRLADVSNIRAGLELFFDDNGRYPISTNDQIDLNDGKTGAKFPNIIKIFPVAPAPADGSCTEANNKYTYKQLNNGQDYKLNFCIGGDVSGYKAGVMELTAVGGIKTITPRTGDAKPVDIFKNVPFNATLHVKMNFSEFNEPVNIEEPKDALDLGSKTRDARRIADVRQIQTALELFYNGNSRYPVSVNGQPDKEDGGVNDKFLNFLATFPDAPTPSDGSCTAVNNKYSYEQLNNGQDFKIGFCLGGKTGGYEAGTRSASVSGIK